MDVKDVIRTTPDRERAMSLMDMAGIRLDSIKLMENSDSRKFASKIVEEYYETILELVTAIMSLDGYKTRSDAVGSHMASINYMRKYREVTDYEIALMDSMRKKRIGVKYYGRNVDPEYIKRKRNEILSLIDKLELITNRMSGGKSRA